MKLVYLCSPLRGNYEENMKRVTEYCKTASELGVITFAPHLYFTQFYRDTIPEEREKGLQLGLAMLDKCEELWVMGNRITQGMASEIAYAKEHHIPIFEIEHPEEKEFYPISADENQLLGRHSCEPDSQEQNYEGKILVMNYDALKEEYRSRPFQLWLATGGFGCSPSARGRRVFATNMYDGEQTSFYRQDFAGIVRKEVLEEVQKQYQFGYTNQESQSTSETEEEGKEP